MADNKTLLFSYGHEHSNGDECWADYSKYFYNQETDEIIEEYTDGWMGEKSTNIITKDEFLKIVDKIQEEYKSYREDPYYYRDNHISYYEIYTDFSDDNREMINNNEEKDFEPEL